MILLGVGLIALAIVLLITSPLHRAGANLGIVAGLVGLAVLFCREMAPLISNLTIQHLSHAKG